MLNVKKTLRNLHKNFPTLDIEQLLKIIDCYEEDIQLESPHWNYRDTIPLNTINHEPLKSNIIANTCCCERSC